MSETWLSPGQKEYEFMDKKYKVFRKDRAVTSISANNGGGVLIAAKNEIDCEQYTTDEMHDLEAVCIKIPSKNKCHIFVYCLYIQPTADSEIYDAHLKAIESIECSPNDAVFITGDWNFGDKIRWHDNDDGIGLLPVLENSQSAKSIIANKCVSFFLQNGYSQLCNLKNKHGNVLDLVITNIPELVSVQKADILLIPEGIEDKAHVQMVCNIETDPIQFNSNTGGEQIYCFRRADYDMIREKLNEINITDIIYDTDLEKQVAKLYEFLHGFFDEFVPKATPRISNRPVWYDKQILKLKNTRNKLYKKLFHERLHNPNADDTEFIAARDEFDSYHKQLYDAYVKKLADDSKYNSKLFWKHINGKRKFNSIPCKIIYENNEATTTKEKADLFAKFFASVYVDHPHDSELIDFVNERNDRNCFKYHITHDAIFNVLRTLDLNKGVGPDLVSPIFLKQCAEFLVDPLYMIYSKSVEENVFPDAWKTGYITPIFKSGSKRDVKNYRGVNVMPTLAKVFERILYNQLKLIVAPLLSKNQHGFISNRNIETNLLELSTLIHDTFEKGAQLDVFYADISKAFDTVNQSLLIRKLAKLPLSNSILKWFISYFSGRKQCVKIDNTKSESFNVPSSVGQGTIIGPLLFLVFFDDSNMCNGDIRSFNFADDSKGACVINNRFDTEKLQSAINKFSIWCNKNGLEVNTSKCKVISFSSKKKSNVIIADYFINDEPIERVYEIRDLGVIMDHKMNFDSHIEYTKRKSESALGFVRRQSRNKLSTETATLLYTSLVRSNLEFANVVWMPHNDDQIKRIESVQKQATIFLTGEYKNRAAHNYVLTPYIERCISVDLTTLIRRRLNAAVMFIHKIISGRYQSPALRGELILNTGIRSLRKPEFIKIKNYRTERSLFSPLNIACRAFNHVALFVDPTLPSSNFKSQLLRLTDGQFGQLIPANLRMEDATK